MNNTNENVFKVWPSLISANLLNLKESIDQLAPYCYGWHIDIMDNHFVPNLTWGAQFVNAIAAYSSKPLWVHLMIDQPELFLNKLHIPKQSYVTFHVETTSNIPLLVQNIKKHGWRAGIAINPNTPIANIYPYVASVDQILIMSVNPGHSGQTFIKSSIDNIVELKHELHKKNVNPTLAVDGGINRNNIVDVAKHGITQFGIASAIFDAQNPVAELKELNHLLADF